MFAPSPDAPRRRASGPEQLHLFRALPGDLAPRDAQDLMAYPFFSLAKSKRLAPIDFRAGAITIRVEAVPEHGMATIWDADVLIWAASQIVNARDAGLRTSRLMAATPYEILTFVGRGASARDYQRLKAGLDRLQSTTVATSIRTSPASLFLDQRMEGESRRQRPGARRRAHPARLVLRWRPRRRARLDHRSRVFLADRRPRALALPRRAQARWRAGVRLEFRLRISAREVRQPLASQAFRL
jgi:Replication initiator protein A